MYAYRFRWDNGQFVVWLVEWSPRNILSWFNTNNEANMLVTRERRSATNEPLRQIGDLPIDWCPFASSFTTTTTTKTSSLVWILTICVQRSTLSTSLDRSSVAELKNHAANQHFFFSDLHHLTTIAYRWHSRYYYFLVAKALVCDLVTGDHSSSNTHMRRMVGGVCCLYSKLAS